MLARLAFDGERSLFTIPRIEGRRPNLVERAERESSLLLDADADRGERSPFDVVGLESASCAGIFFREIERRIQDGDNRSIDDGVSVGMMSSDIEEV